MSQCPSVCSSLDWKKDTRAWNKIAKHPVTLPGQPQKLQTGCQEDTFVYPNLLAQIPPGLGLLPAVWRPNTKKISVLFSESLGVKLPPNSSAQPKVLNCSCSIASTFSTSEFLQEQQRQHSLGLNTKKSQRLASTKECNPENHPITVRNSFNLGIFILLAQGKV